MSAELTCVRCGRTAEPLPKPPLRGPLGFEIWPRSVRLLVGLAADRVMVINELRLNFMIPPPRDPDASCASSCCSTSAPAP